MTEDVLNEEYRAELAAQATAVMEELIERAKLVSGNIAVVGCSTSEIVGSKIGTDSQPEVAKVVFEAIWEVAKAHGVFLAAQCCEHLNRAIIIERAAVPGADIVNVVPQPKAGGSFATQAYHHFSTLIGMHLKKVAVPLRLANNRIGEATVLAARVRPKFIGGVRAVYDEELL